MIGMLVKVSVAIIELIPRSLLSVMRDRGPFYLLLESIGILLLELNIPIRAGAGAHFIKGALIPNDIRLADLLRRVLAVLMALKVPRYYSWGSFRLRVGYRSSSDLPTLVLHPSFYFRTNLVRFLSQSEVVEVSSEV